MTVRSLPSSYSLFLFTDNSFPQVTKKARRLQAQKTKYGRTRGCALTNRIPLPRNQIFRNPFVSWHKLGYSVYLCADIGAGSRNGTSSTVRSQRSFTSSYERKIPSRPRRVRRGVTIREIEMGVLFIAGFGRKRESTCYQVSYFLSQAVILEIYSAPSGKSAIFFQNIPDCEDK